MVGKTANFLTDTKPQAQGGRVLGNGNGEPEFRLVSGKCTEKSVNTRFWLGFTRVSYLSSDSCQYFNLNQYICKYCDYNGV